MTIWIVTVNFGDTKSTEQLIDSLSVVNNLKSAKIIIADNASSFSSRSGLEQIIKKSFLDIKIFSYKKNLYYWPAINKVIKSLKTKFGTYPDWIIVCNNDITFSDKNLFEKLSKIDTKKFPIVGPTIINSDGKHLNPFMLASLSKWQRFFWRCYFFSYPLSIILLMIKKLLDFFILKSNQEKISTNKSVYAVHGSAIFFSNHFFNMGGWFDENFELYGEELTVAEIAKKLNIPVTYFPELEVTHHEHTSTKSINKRKLFYKAKKSHQYFESTYLK